MHPICWRALTPFDIEKAALQIGAPGVAINDAEQQGHNDAVALLSRFGHDENVISRNCISFEFIQKSNKRIDASIRSLIFHCA